ncbi:MAG: hypothetical protein WBJ41_14505 [Chromatiaceae bacterium]
MIAGAPVTAPKCETVVALINGHQMTLKRFYVAAAGVRLQPAKASTSGFYSDGHRPCRIAS